MNTKKMVGKSQMEAVYDYIKTGRSISPAEARKVFGVESLSTIMSKLKYKWNCNIRTTRTQDAVGTRYIRYSMAGKRVR